MRKRKGGDVSIRPVPGFPGYYAGDDGRLYRNMPGHVNPDSPKLYASVYDESHRTVSRPLGWFVALAWVGGFDGERRMKAEHLNGDWLDTRPRNLAWREAKRPVAEISRESRKRALAQLKGNADDPRHGTRTGYRYGCRCARCRAMAPVIHQSNQLKRAIRELEEVRDA